MSRYVERAITVGRLLDVTLHHNLDAGDLGETSKGLWAPLVGFAGDEGEHFLELHPEPTPGEVRRYLAFDEENPNALVLCVRRARWAAQRVRESISSEMWENLNALYLSLLIPDLAATEDDPHAFYQRVREAAQTFQGLADGTLAHDEPWHFFSLGKYLERADDTARLLDLQSHLLATDLGGGADPTVRGLAVLRSCGMAEAYARYYSLRIEPARIVEFALLNPVFPQSVRFSLATAQQALDAIVTATPEDRTGPAMRVMGRLYGLLEHAAVDEILEEGLEEFLRDVKQRIRGVGEAVEHRYFRDELPPGRLVGVARAAMIMAAQQQQ